MAASAAPYGYTLTIWGSGAVAMHRLGKPGVGEALLLMGGAVLGFLLMEALAHGSLRARVSPRQPSQTTGWANAHLLSGGGGIVLVWALLQAADARVGWALAGFVATASYLLLNAIQSTVATRAGGDPG